MKTRVILAVAVIATSLAAFALLPACPVAPLAHVSDVPALAPTALRSSKLRTRTPEPTPSLEAVVPAALVSPASVLEEDAFMRDLRVLSDMDAELTVERAREGATRFGASTDAPERRSLLIHALSRLGRASEARGEAESMVNECPDSAWVREVEQFTGAHRHRNIRLAANGELEYF